ncbi:MAG TPA: energy transducer TonB [Vicinamibacterales bacterium]|nr:energy transducer TonB [Vicinamibacterales bacterium]
MRHIFRVRAIILCLVISVTACAQPPTTDVDAAKAAVDRAATHRADQYAAESLKAAQDARAALDAELKAQEGKWVKSYDKTKELAVAAKEAGDKATGDAVVAKEKAEAKARADAAAAKAEATRRALLRITRQVRPPTKVFDVRPVYPAAAQSSHVTGTVTVEATLAENGTVIDAKVVRSIPLLDQTALDSVRQWMYTPTLLNGVPVRVLVTVTVKFPPQY